jgi:hypothetical protein
MRYLTAILREQRDKEQRDKEQRDKEHSTPTLDSIRAMLRTLPEHPLVNTISENDNEIRW